MGIYSAFEYFHNIRTSVIGDYFQYIIFLIVHRLTKTVNDFYGFGSIAIQILPVVLCLPLRWFNKLQLITVRVRTRSFIQYLITMNNTLQSLL